MNNRYMMRGVSVTRKMCIMLSRTLTKVFTHRLSVRLSPIFLAETQSIATLCMPTVLEQSALAYMWLEGDWRPKRRGIGAGCYRNEYRRLARVR